MTPVKVNKYETNLTLITCFLRFHSKADFISFIRDKKSTLPKVQCPLNLKEFWKFDCNFRPDLFTKHTFRFSEKTFNCQKAYNFV